MDNLNMIENLDKLPPLLQFIIILVWFIVPPAYANRRIRIESEANRRKIEAESNAKVRLEKELAEQRLRLETLELQHIKAESEAKQAEKASANTEKLIEVIAASNDRFQKTLDVKSERQLEADKMQHETNKMFLGAVERQTVVVSNLTEMLEIQSEQLGKVVDTVASVGGSVKSNLQTMEQLARDNQTQVTTALGLSVTHRAESDTMLQAILKTINDVARDINSIVTRNEDNRLMTLQGINTKLHSIEANIAALIAPRPTVLGDTMPLPTPEIWDEDAEVTANIPPRQLTDADGNLKPAPFDDTENKPPKVA